MPDSGMVKTAAEGLPKVTLRAALAVAAVAPFAATVRADANKDELPVDRVKRLRIKWQRPTKNRTIADGKPINARKWLPEIFISRRRLESSSCPTGTEQADKTLERELGVQLMVCATKRAELRRKGRLLRDPEQRRTWKSGIWRQIQ